MAINFPDAPTDNQTFEVGSDAFVWKAAVGAWLPATDRPTMADLYYSKTVFLELNKPLFTTPGNVMSTGPLWSGKVGVASRWKISAVMSAWPPSGSAASWLWGGLYRNSVAAANIIAMSEVLCGGVGWAASVRIEAIIDITTVGGDLIWLGGASSSPMTVAGASPGWGAGGIWAPNKNTSLTATRIG